MSEPLSAERGTAITVGLTGVAAVAVDDVAGLAAALVVFGVGMAIALYWYQGEAA